MSKALAFPVGSLEIGMWITPGNPEAPGPREFESRKLLFGFAFAFSLPRLARLDGLATIAPAKTGIGMNEDHWL